MPDSSTGDAEYIGCFKDDKEDRVMAHKIFDDENMSAAYCRDHCADKDALYYGTQVCVRVGVFLISIDVANRLALFSSFVFLFFGLWVSQSCCPTHFVSFGQRLFPLAKPCLTSLHFLVPFSGVRSLARSAPAPLFNNHTVVNRVLVRYVIGGGRLREAWIYDMRHGLPGKRRRSLRCVLRLVSWVCGRARNSFI